MHIQVLRKMLTGGFKESRQRELDASGMRVITLHEVCAAQVIYIYI